MFWRLKKYKILFSKLFQLAIFRMKIFVRKMRR